MWESGVKIKDMRLVYKAAFQLDILYASHFMETNLMIAKEGLMEDPVYNIHEVIVAFIRIIYY